MQHTIFFRMGLIILALVLAGCTYPTETIYQETPVEVPEEGESEPETAPEIAGFTFTQVNPLRAANSGNGALVGRLSDPIGGTPPFSYSLVTGAESTDNWRFAVAGDLLKVQSGPLTAGTYFVRIGRTDWKGLLYTQAVKILVVPDYVALAQETHTVKGINFKMRYVPSGAFIKPDGGSDIEVTITGFWMAETEVTQELYEAVMGENPSGFNSNAAPGEVQVRRPVENITWSEAILFCNRLSIMTGREAVYHFWGIPDWENYLKWAISTGSSSTAANIYVVEEANGYRLPTLDEWLWAAMGADLQNPGQVNTTGAKKYYSGGEVESNVGMENFVWSSYSSLSITREVGKKRSNELGIFDMTGNVSEWVYEVTTPGTIFVSHMGHTWNYAGSIPLYSSHVFSFPNARNAHIGFRIARNQ